MSSLVSKKMNVCLEWWNKRSSTVLANQSKISQMKNLKAIWDLIVTRKYGVSAKTIGIVSKCCCVLNVIYILSNNLTLQSSFGPSPQKTLNNRWAFIISIISSEYPTVRQHGWGREIHLINFQKAHRFWMKCIPILIGSKSSANVLEGEGKENKKGWPPVWHLQDLLFLQWRCYPIRTVWQLLPSALSSFLS